MTKIVLKNVEPKNKKQKEFISALSDFPVVISIGSAGSGKTYLAAYKALEQLSYQFIDRIVIVRPAVATEKLGFLPGDMKDKLDPYLAPILDSLCNVSNPKLIHELSTEGTIEIAPLAFMRGRTFSNAFIILDEAQNTTIEQMKMFLTRFGENVKVVITGDHTQSDISGQNGLLWAIEVLAASKSVSVIKYENKDVVRSSLVREILYHIEKAEKNETTSKNTNISKGKVDTRSSIPGSTESSYKATT